MSEARPLPAVHEHAREPVPPSSWSEVRRTIAGTMMLVIACNFVALPFLRRWTPNVGYQVVEKKWALLRDLQQPVDWLILGDSSCNQGVDPELLTRRLGGRALNLCTLADMSVLSDAWMLEAYVQRFGRPAHVVVIHVYEAWGRPVDRVRVSRVPLEWGFWDRVHPRLDLTAAEKRRAVLERYVPLYSQNASLADWFATPWLALRRAHRATLTPAGFMPVRRGDVRGVRADIEGQLRLAQRRQGAISPESRAALTAIADSARKLSFPVYVANSPIVDDLLTEPAFREHYTSVVGTIAGAIEREPGMHFLLRTPMTFPATEMENADHVLVSAATAYTERLAAEIKAVANRGAATK
jgi:hypothetical protein